MYLLAAVLPFVVVPWLWDVARVWFASRRQRQARRFLRHQWRYL